MRSNHLNQEEYINYLENDIHSESIKDKEILPLDKISI